MLCDNVFIITDTSGGYKNNPKCNCNNKTSKGIFHADNDNREWDQFDEEEERW